MGGTESIHTVPKKIENIHLIVNCEPFVLNNFSKGVQYSHPDISDRFPCLFCSILPL